jgi:hypothetical protein
MNVSKPRIYSIFWKENENQESQENHSPLPIDISPTHFGSHNNGTVEVNQVQLERNGS